MTIQRALHYLIHKKGIRIERIAADLEYSAASVMNWMAGRRKPKKLVLLRIEQLFGVKIG